MVIVNKNIKLIVTILSVYPYEQEFLKKFFNNEKIQVEQSQNEECWTVIFNSNINRTTLNKLLFELTKQNQNFELNLDSEDEYVYEKYVYKVGDVFITKSFINEIPTNGREHLLNMLFHEQKENIKIDDLIRDNN